MWYQIRNLGSKIAIKLGNIQFQISCLFRCWASETVKVMEQEITKKTDPEVPEPEPDVQPVPAPEPELEVQPDPAPEPENPELTEETVPQEPVSIKETLPEELQKASVADLRTMFSTQSP